MTDCVLYSESTCVSEVNAAENKARTQLPGLLDTAYNGIRCTRPNARVVVVDYPRSTTWPSVLRRAERHLPRQDQRGRRRAGRRSPARGPRHGFAFADVRAGSPPATRSATATAWLHSVDLGNFVAVVPPDRCRPVAACYLRRSPRTRARARPRRLYPPATEGRISTSAPAGTGAPSPPSARASSPSM